MATPEAKLKDQSQSPSLYEIKTLLTWKAPARPFKKRTGTFFRTSILIALLIIVILFLFSDWFGILVVLAFLFLTFVLASVPPHESTYKISTEGFTFDDHFFLWQELYDFYFKKRFDTDMLHVRTQALIPGELLVPLGETIIKEQIRSVMARFLPYREVVKPTFMDKSGDWLSRTFPLENSSPSNQTKPRVAS